MAQYSGGNMFQQSQLQPGVATQYTPPLTPQTIQSANNEEQEEVYDSFHNYLRAFHDFHPSATMFSDNEESSITVPINQGDVILVHSIQPNGWADGTLLTSGARGWLPTNYCEPYDHDMVRSLLDALTYVWEFIRSHEDGDTQVFLKQDYVRAMIAGVRFLLERSGCLTRDAPLVKSHVSIRRLRKSILGDLAAFVKAAKALQESCRQEFGVRPEDLYDLLDNIVLKAFKVVTRAVKLFDVWSQDVNSKVLQSLSLPCGSPPLTPGSDGFAQTNEENLFQKSERNVASDPLVQPSDENSPRRNPNPERQPESRHTAHRGSTNGTSVEYRPLPIAQKRQSAAHRLSYNPSSYFSSGESLVSKRLYDARDAFLSSLAVFLGRVHAQSRSSLKLLESTQLAVARCQSLLLVLEAVWDRDGRQTPILFEVREVMHMKLVDLVSATKKVFNATEYPDETNTDASAYSNILEQAATECVRAGNNLLTQTQSVVERLGDFTYQEPSSQETTGLGIFEFDEQRRLHLKQEDHIKAAHSAAAILSTEIKLSRSSAPEAIEVPSMNTSTTSDAEAQVDFKVSTAESSDSGRRSSETVVGRSSSFISKKSIWSDTIPSLELEIPLASPIQFPDPPASTQPDPEPRTVSEDSAPETSCTYESSVRNSETSLKSDASTCVTTPEQSPVKDIASEDMVGSRDSFTDAKSTSTDDHEDAESQLLTTTYAHELVFSKDGQVSGGSLNALVERLTTHDATPEAVFVNTFYLTFRLFTTPLDFAHALIHRFDYIAQNQDFAAPVRLRVYNVFKGWLESHWQQEPDKEAVDDILAFANDKLKVCLPSAGKRLVELINKVSVNADGPLVPRLVSAMGKTSTAVTSTVSADAPMPNPVVSKSQLNLLRKVDSGNASCSVLDFDPLELARQFTIIESKLFCAIQPEELLASEWMKKTDSKAVNVRAMSTLSTDLANLVADTILQPEEPKKRAAVVKQWVKIAKKCRELNNYDSLLAIICSLNSSMVSRLKRTWDLLSPKTLARLEELRSIVDCSRNYSSLRQLLQNHVAPCIPFVGLYLTDLTFVDVGNQTKRQLNRSSRYGPCSEQSGESAECVSVINFDKHVKTAKIIGDLQRFQIPYRLAPVPEMQNWMETQIQRVRTSEEANVQTFYRRSLLLEPREPQPPRTTPPLGDLATAYSSFSSDNSVASSGKESQPTSSTKEKFEMWSAKHFNTSMTHLGRERVVS